jgi:hypothetical protein
MIYFCKQGFAYQTKNNLQKAAQANVGNLDGLMVQSPEAFGHYLTRLVDLLNPRFNRSTPLELRTRASGKTRIFSIHDSRTFEGHVTEFILYPIVGEFMKLDGNETRIAIWQYCRQCGCTELMACDHPRLGTCWWVEEAANEQGPLCSHCHLVETNEITPDSVERLWKEVSHE